MLRTLSVLRGLRATPAEDLTEPRIAMASQGDTGEAVVIVQITPNFVHVALSAVDTL